MSEPRIDLDFAVHWCARHLEPYRAKWPMGAGVAMVQLFDAAVRHPDIVAAVTKDEQGRGKTHHLAPVIREFSPLCCLVGEEAMAKIYADAVPK